MSKSKTVTLTGPQASVVLDALNYYMTVLDDQIDAREPGAIRKANTLQRAAARFGWRL